MIREEVIETVKNYRVRRERERGEREREREHQNIYTKLCHMCIIHKYIEALEKKNSSSSS